MPFSPNVHLWWHGFLFQFVLSVMKFSYPTLFQGWVVYLTVAFYYCVLVTFSVAEITKWSFYSRESTHFFHVSLEDGRHLSGRSCSCFPASWDGWKWAASPGTRPSLLSHLHSTPSAWACLIHFNTAFQIGCLCLVSRIPPVCRKHLRRLQSSITSRESRASSSVGLLIDYGLNDVTFLSPCRRFLSSSPCRTPLMSLVMSSRRLFIER